MTPPHNYKIVSPENFHFRKIFKINEKKKINPRNFSLLFCFVQIEPQLKLPETLVYENKIFLQL